jgi:hypothetical protein
MLGHWNVENVGVTGTGGGTPAGRTVGYAPAAAEDQQRSGEKNGQQKSRFHRISFTFALRATAHP